MKMKDFRKQLKLDADNTAMYGGKILIYYTQNLQKLNILFKKDKNRKLKTLNIT